MSDKQHVDLLISGSGDGRGPHGLVFRGAGSIECLKFAHLLRSRLTQKSFEVTQGLRGRIRIVSTKTYSS
jgi:hypothetical protein